MPEGNAPLSEMTGVGEPEVVIRIGAIAELTAEDAEDPLVNDGAMAGEATPRAFRSDGAPKAIAPRRALENVRAIATALSSVGSSETPALIVPTSRRTRTRGTIVAAGDGITSEEPKPSTCGRMVKDRWARASVVLGVEREASHPPQEERANNTAPRPESPIPRNNALRSSTRELPSAARCILRTIVPIKAADGAVVDTLLSRKTSGGVTSFGGRRGSTRFGAGGSRTNRTARIAPSISANCSRFNVAVVTSQKFVSRSDEAGRRSISQNSLLPWSRFTSPEVVSLRSRSVALRRRQRLRQVEWRAL